MQSSERILTAFACIDAGLAHLAMVKAYMPQDQRMRINRLEAQVRMLKAPMEREMTEEQLEQMEDAVTKIGDAVAQSIISD